jgi:hypothetical protein
MIANAKHLPDAVQRDSVAPLIRIVTSAELITIPVLQRNAWRCAAPGKCCDERRNAPEASSVLMGTQWLIFSG